MHSGNVLVGQAMEKIDTRLGWNAPSNRWGVALVVDSLTNVQYIKAINTLGSAVGEPYAYLTRPRTIALEPSTGIDRCHHHTRRSARLVTQLSNWKSTRCRPA